MEQEQYKHVEKLIRRSKNLFIVSPYIDEYYARFLLKHARNKKIYIISSSPEGKAKKMLTKGSFPSLTFLLSVIMFSLYYLLWLAGLSYIPILIIGSLFFALFIVRLSTRKPKNIKLKVPKEFIHAKFYVGDAEAITGSANLTYRGMHKNIEHLEISNDPNYIKKLKAEFWRMWNV
ncbi:MAG: phospholipase D-like domain-containing protein [Candidatus Micrarchaeota archaeon]